MSSFPYSPVEVAWERPPIDREVLRQCSKRSNIKAILHCLGVLVVLGASGGLAYWAFSTGRWVAMAILLYVHGGLLAFGPQTHELAHGTMFRTPWLNSLFKRLFGFIHWQSNSALYWMSHKHHHRYTLHKQSEGEVVLPAAEMTERILNKAIHVIDLSGLISALYDQVYSIFRPYLRNSRRTIWQRYAYEQSRPSQRRNAYWTRLSQFVFHLLFAAFAIATGRWFLIVVVTLPSFYGGGWYHLWVHDTMHVGRKSETIDFRECCRSVRVDPFTSLMYWHMEWHTEHHTYPAIPCYNLRKFYRLTAEHWDKPQTLFAAWREMNRESEKILSIPEKG